MFKKNVKSLNSRSKHPDFTKKNVSKYVMLKLATEK